MQLKSRQWNLQSVFFNEIPYQASNILNMQQYLCLDPLLEIFQFPYKCDSRAVQLMQLNYCEGALSNAFNSLLGQLISQHTAISTSKSTLTI